MENKLFDNLKNKNISESSLKLYISNLKRLNGNIEPKNLNFLKNVESIVEKIKDYKPNTRRSYIISIVSTLKHEPKLKKLYDAYYKILMEYNNELKTNNTKSDTQKENWISQDEVNTIYKEMGDKVKESLKDKKKISFNEWDDLQKYLVLSLYTLQPPRRNLDYQYMIVVNKYIPDNIDKKYNYLDLEKNQFHFNNYKTKGTYSTQTTDVSPELREVVNLYLKYHPLRNHLKKKSNFIPLLTDYEGLPYESKNTITRILNKIFKKNIGSSMLRNIYLTHKFGDKVDELNKTATQMGTSSNTIQNQYIKIDLDEE
jgi:integrase